MTNDGFLASNSTCGEGTCPLVAESSGWASDGGETSLIERGELCNTAASWAVGHLASINWLLLARGVGIELTPITPSVLPFLSDWSGYRAKDTRTRESVAIYFKSFVFCIGVRR